MRKLAIGAWSSPNDPSVNVQLDLDVTKLVAYLDTQPGITLKHALVKIFSTTIHNVPELNTVLIRSKFRQRLNNRIFIPTVFRHRSVLDLNGIAIDDAHAMSLTNLKSTWDQKLVIYVQVQIAPYTVLPLSLNGCPHGSVVQQ